ncbi:MAG: transcriptional repressor [Sphingobacterium sp.]
MKSKKLKTDGLTFKPLTLESHWMSIVGNSQKIATWCALPRTNENPGKCFTPERILGELIEHNVMLTRQRQDVITAMCRLREIEDAEALWLHLMRNKKISVAAVYNTLNILTRYGIVSKDMVDTRRASYRMACLQKNVPVNFGE